MSKVMASDLTPTERRSARRRLYELLAAIHSGPLGAELVPHLRRVAAALGIEGLPDTPGAVPADLYRWSYGYCPGNPQLGCPAASPVGCIPAKFMRLAQSAGKGAAARRAREADFVESQLLPCLHTVHTHMQVEAYRDLVALSIAVAQGDAAQLREREAKP